MHQMQTFQSMSKTTMYERKVKEGRGGTGCSAHTHCGEMKELALRADVMLVSRLPFLVTLFSQVGCCTAHVVRIWKTTKWEYFLVGVVF